MRRAAPLLVATAALVSVSAATAATRQPIQANRSTAVPAAAPTVAAFTAAAEQTTRARPIAPDMTRGIDALRLNGAGRAQGSFGAPGLARPFP